MNISKRDYDFCWTVNNPPQDFAVREAGVRYYIWQLESGEKEATPHAQGFTQFMNNKTLSAAKKFIGHNCHIEVRRGSVTQAAAYCKKEPRLKGPFEYGRSSGGQGTRTDLIAFKDAVVSGKRKREMLDDHPTVIAKYRHFYSDILELFMPTRKDRNVLILFGEPGVGKTTFVRDEWKDQNYWTLPLSRDGIWFDGYDGQEKVLLDDFAGGKSGIRLVHLLRLLHPFPERVEVKGGHVWWNPTEIVITTNIHPNDWYTYKGRANQRWALKRRISGVIIMKSDGTSETANESWWNCSQSYLDALPPSY